MRYIWAAAIDPFLDSMEPFSGAPLIFQIATLKVTTEVTTLTAFLQAKFGRGGSIVLSDFRLLQSRPDSSTKNPGKDGMLGKLLG